MVVLIVCFYYFKRLCLHFKKINKSDVRSQRCVSPPPAAPWSWWFAARWERCTPECFQSESDSHSCGLKRWEPDTSSPPCPSGHTAGEGRGRKEWIKGRRTDGSKERRMRSKVANVLRSASRSGTLQATITEVKGQWLLAVDDDTTSALVCH